MLRGALAVALLTSSLALGNPREAAASADESVTVRTYNYARLPVARLANARLSTETVFKNAKISLQWIDCRVPQSDGEACTEPLHPGRDLMLRLVESAEGPANRGRTVVLGTSMLDREQGGGVLMTVNLLPIRAIAAQASTDFATLLGWAIAHEIGHLLLGTSEHSREGLMRARWLQDELRGLTPASWKFSSREVAQMRQGLAVKARAANEPGRLRYTPGMANNLKSGLAGAMAALTLAVPAWAQTSRIGGVVRDETGGTIRGVIVRAESGGTGTAGALMSLTTATDDRGRFVFVISRSGDWRITFEAPGFDRMTIPVGVRLSGPAPNLDVKLERRETPEAFGALAGVDSRALSAQLAAAAALLDEGRYDPAIAAYLDIKAKVPALTVVNLPMGNAYLAKKSYGEAEAAFQEILKSDPSDTNGLFAMGALREAQGNAAEAQGWYEKAATADATWTRPLMKLAALAAATGDRAAASRHLTRVVEIDPVSPDGQQAAAMLQK